MEHKTSGKTSLLFGPTYETRCRWGEEFLRRLGKKIKKKRKLNLCHPIKKLRRKKHNVSGPASPDRYAKRKAKNKRVGKDWGNQKIAQKHPISGTPEHGGSREWGSMSCEHDGRPEKKRKHVFKILSVGGPEQKKKNKTRKNRKEKRSSFNPVLLITNTGILAGCRI